MSNLFGAWATLTWYRIALHDPHDQQAVSSFTTGLSCVLQIYEEGAEQLINQATVDWDDASDHLLMYRGTVRFPFTVSVSLLRKGNSRSSAVELNLK
ncbi:MAG TPA: hypothetical protein VFD11_02190 [Thiopseudomonas sp.]|nr:hypothetical protein [Thiopseudomonas sp.]